MALNIFQVQLELEEEGWGLNSDSYTNLKTPISITCPKGHKQEKSFGEWRKNRMCEVCLAGDPSQAKRGKIPVKKLDTYRVLALDAATGITGYSIYDNGELVNFGLHKTPSGAINATEKINEVKYWLNDIIQDAKPDFIGIENIQLQQFGHSTQVEMYRVLANLQGVLVDTVYEAGIECKLAYSSTWRKYCGVEGKGREEMKKAAQDKVLNWYGLKCTQDEADAICIGKYFSGSHKTQIDGSWG